MKPNNNKQHSKSLFLNFFMKYRYLIGGFTFLCIQMFIYIVNIGAYDFSFYYWYCNHIPILFSIAFFLKQYQLVKGLIHVGLIPQIMWVLDLTLYWLFSFQLFGFTQYFFELESTLQIISTLFIHIFSSSLAFLFTLNINPNKKSLYFAFGYVSILLLVTLTFTQVEQNINCVHEICGLEELTPPLYTWLFPFLTFIIMILPSYYLQREIYKFLQHQL